MLYVPSVTELEKKKITNIEEHIVNCTTLCISYVSSSFSFCHYIVDS